MSSSEVKIGLKNKIAGSLYGFCIGDSLGATTEFMDSDQVIAKYGRVKDMIGGGWLNLKPGEVTDDTEMTMCIIDSFLSDIDSSDVDVFKKDVAKRFVAWLEGMPKDVGGACLAGIEYFADNGKFIGRDDEVLGNGALMRALPCALLGLYDHNDQQGVITHNSLKSREVIQTYSKIIQDLLMGKPFDTDVKGPQKPTGCLTNTFNNVLWWNKIGKTYSQVVLEAVNDGGDSDTIAAIAGSIAGLRFGLSGIPGKWLKKVPVELKKKIGKFTDYCLENIDY